MNLSSLMPFLKISGLTVAGALLGSLSSVSVMPSSFAEWKAMLLPALWAAFLAERLLLQQTVASSAIAAVAPAPPPSSAKAMP